jgi:hypothetical protein
MVTLRCTAKLLKRLDIERHPPNPPPPTNALGDWYADIVYTRPAHLVLCLSERTGLCVIVEARDLHSLVPRFIRRLQELLRYIRVPPEAVDREIAATSDLAFGATTNRSAIALMNRAVMELKYFFPQGDDLSVHDLSNHFSGRPCGNPMHFPDEVARALLSPRSKFTLLDGGTS